MSLLLDTAFGDTICTREDQLRAEAAITSLHTYNDQVGRPAQFQAAVNAIDAQSKEWHDSWWHDFSLFPICQLKEIGLRAEQLTQQIATWAGVVGPVPDPTLQPGPTSELGSTIGKVIVGGLVVVVVWGLSTFGGSGGAAVSVASSAARRYRRKQR